MLEDLRTCRATTFLGLCWIAVFALMHLLQWFEVTPGTPPGSRVLGFGQIGVQTAHLCGALRWNDILAGEVWRLITATFIHFNVLHLLMNLVGLLQLGFLMEPWYGSRQFLAMLLAIGGIGNLIGGLLRQGFYQLRSVIEASGMGRLLPDFFRNGGLPGAGVPVTSGGGSTIILGMIGLAMVVGWRSRTRVGMFLRDQMIGFLGFTALLGVVLAKLVDNYGHFGGACAGVFLGFLHRPLVRTAERGWIRLVVGIAAVTILAGSFLAQGMSATRTLERGRLQSERLLESERLRRRGQATVGLIDALEKLDAALAQLQLLEEPIGLGEIDWPEDLGRTPPTPPPAPAKVIQARVAARREVERRLAMLAAARQTLDADLAAGEIDEASEIARDSISGPIAARRFYEFQVLARRVAKNARDRQLEIVERLRSVEQAYNADQVKN
ncbi:MAG: rhomboid family intramembrane serine protease [Isosphaeraceae bacterium]|nr:rhomboid family intramembrane serine protease [Isosphaeraceae bacterium]